MWFVARFISVKKNYRYEYGYITFLHLERLLNKIIFDQGFVYALYKLEIMHN